MSQHCLGLNPSLACKKVANDLGGGGMSVVLRWILLKPPDSGDRQQAIDGNARPSMVRDSEQSVAMP